MSISAEKVEKIEETLDDVVCDLLAGLIPTVRFRQGVGRAEMAILRLKPKEAAAELELIIAGLLQVVTGVCEVSWRLQEQIDSGPLDKSPEAKEARLEALRVEISERLKESFREALQK